MMGKGVEDIATKLKSFQKRYYWNVFLKGSILSLSIIIGYYLVVALLEYTLWLQTWIRFLIFFSFLGVVLYSIARFLREPLKYWVIKKGIGDEESARIIGRNLPDVKDRLLNLLQLQSKVGESSLAAASIFQRSNELGSLNFESTINYAENTRFLKYLIIPIVVAAFIFLFDSKILVGSTDRIIHFTKSYTPQAPFAFNIDTKALVAYYNEDFTLDVNISGEAIPQDLYILLNQSQRFKLQANGSNSFSFVFENIQESVDFNLEGAGFLSENYRIDVMHRPELNSLSIELDYPPYIHKSRSISNSGNLEIPEGTSVNWKLTTSFADSASIIFQSEKKEFYLSISDNQVFNYEKRVVEDDQYDLLLRNNVSQNKDKISYTVRVIKDQYPKIALSNFTDSVLYKQIVLGGVISDDYGITQLDLIYSVTDDRKKEVKSNRISIPINKSQFQQSFFYNWSLDSVELKAGYQLEYYLKVWDNDGVNGRKSSRTASYNFYLPSDDQLVADINKSSEQTQQKIDESVSNAAKLQDKIEQANQRLKGKQSLDWQDKKMLEEIITQKNNLEKLINEFKDENKLLNEKKDAFSDQDEKIKEKAEQIQKLMDELLDDETKKLFEELQKLLKENSDAAQMQKLLDKLDQNTDNLEKELDRMLEIYKQLKFETMYDQAENLLKQQIENQKELLEKTEQAEKNNDKKENNSEQSKDQSNSENQELAKEQEKLKEESEQLKEQLKELDKLGEEIDDNTEVPDESEMEDIMNDQEDSQEMLEQNSPSKSKQKQQNALQKMQQMKDKMESSQNSMSMEMDMENIEALRQIIHGLIKLSYDQESLMKRFGELQSGDPQINTLAETQLQVKDNAKVLEDSLLALAKRDPFMGSFITREISELNEHLDKVNDANRERRKPQAQTEMQASMTSFNNLALMLDSHYDMLMQMMANAKPSMKGKGKKKGDNPGLSQLQQQLNQKIEQLKNSGKSGREMSEELAKMAAEQERIRRAIQEMQEKMKEGGKMPGGDLPSKMEQTEMDLVNKQLTDQLIKRQQDILTRLLETEKSMREQDQDEERKGETAKDYEKEVPKAFEEYLRLKEKEVELLKTVPPKLYPYYKKEVDEYFKRIGNQ